jgi:hypothetical protein
MAHDYGKMPAEALKAHVAQGILSAFFNRHEKTTLLMTLVSTREVSNPCGTKGNKHGYCRMVLTLLKALPEKERNQLLAVKTRRCGKSALHWAATVGEF